MTIEEKKELRGWLIFVAIAVPLLIVAIMGIIRQGNKQLTIPYEVYTNRELYCVENFIIETKNKMIFIEENDIQEVRYYRAIFPIGLIKEWEFVFYDGTVKRYRETENLQIKFLENPYCENGIDIE